MDALIHHLTGKAVQSSPAGGAAFDGKAQGADAAVSIGYRF